MPRPRSEPEITPEMVEAGATVLCGVGIDTGFESPSGLAVRVYRAMRSLLRESGSRGASDWHSRPRDPRAAHKTEFRE